jgi:glycosyltransferase involved in cell wall biosynthesis
MDTASPDITAIICTYNPVLPLLEEVIAALSAQHTPGSRVAVLIVDNNSSTPVAQSLAGRVPENFTIVREETPGLTAARLRGIRESRGDLLVFVDDDNILDADYLETCIGISRDWPRLGTWGGQLVPRWESTPEPWTQRYWNWIAVRPLEKDLWSNVTTTQATMPCGGGMCVRRVVAESYASAIASNPMRKGLDRNSGALFGGGDTDICYTAADLGYGNGLFSRLRLTHHIPAFRTSESYLLKLVEDMTCSNAILARSRDMEVSMPCRSERMLRAYQRLFISRRDRRFAIARDRGLMRARDLLASMERR